MVSHRDVKKITEKNHMELRSPISPRTYER